MRYKFSEVSQLNLERSLIWHEGGLDAWSPTDWACAMAGEAGEVCNGAKKLKRHTDGIRQHRSEKCTADLIEDIGTEIGDTFLYLDLLAQRLGLDIEDCIVKTFNRVSIREGFDQRL